MMNTLKTRLRPLLIAGAALSLHVAAGCAEPAASDTGTSNDAFTAASKLVVANGKWKKVSVSDMRTCAVRESGATVCWGSHFVPGPSICPTCAVGMVLEPGPAQQLGLATEVLATSPTGMAPHLTGCAQRSTGTWECPRFTGDLLPADFVPPPEPLTQVVDGGNVMCGIRPDKTITCWGRSSNDPAWQPPTGQFRDAALIQSPGSFTGCGLRDDNQELECWGQAMPTVPSGPFTQLTKSFAQATICGLRTDGSLDCLLPMGSPAITIPGTEDNDFYRELPPTKRFDKVGLGNVQACGIERGDKSVFCWGEKRWEEHQPSNGLIDKAPPGKFKDISVASWHACAIRDDDALVCWGDEKAFDGLARRDLGVFAVP